jgi:hypothetical protein
MLLGVPALTDDGQNPALLVLVLAFYCVMSLETEAYGLQR